MTSNITSENPKLWTRGFIFLILTNLFVYQGFQMLIPVLPVYIKGIGGTDLQASLATSLFAISGLIFRSLTGIGVDKYGRKLLLIIGFIVLFLLNVSLFWTSVVALILVLRFIHGIGWGITSTTIATVMSDTVPAKRRGEGTGYYALSVILATSAAPMIAIAIMNKFDFKVVLTVSTVVIVIGFILAQGMTIKKIKVEKTADQNFWKDLFEKKALFPAFLCLLLAIPFGALMSYILLFGKEIGVENVWVYYIGHCLMIIISRPFIGKLFDRRGHVWAILPGVISMFIGLLLLSFTNGVIMLILASLFFGFGFGAAQPSLQAWAINRSPDNRKGAASGTFLSAMDLGAALGIFLLGMAGSAFGYHMMFRIGSYCIVVLILFYVIYLLKNRHPHTKKVSERIVSETGNHMSGDVSMSFCSNILIAYNDTKLSNKALQTARKIASEHKETQIDILYALEAPLGYNFEPAQGYQAGKEEITDYANAVVAKARDTFEDLPNKVHVFSVDSDPLNAILNHSEKYHNDLIIIGNRGLKGAKEYFSSVSHAVVQESPVPVLLVK